MPFPSCPSIQLKQSHSPIATSAALQFCSLPCAHIHVKIPRSKSLADIKIPQLPRPRVRQTREEQQPSSIFPDNYAVIGLKVFRSPLSPMASPPVRREPSMSDYIRSAEDKDPPDRAKHCGFQMHILAATQLAALFGLLLALFRLAFWCLEPVPDLDQIGPLLHNLALLGAHGLLLCALPLRMASLCLPFLVVNPISLFLVLRFMSSLLAIISEWPLLDTLLGIGTMAEVAEEDRQLASASLRLTLLWLPPLVLSLVLLCWLQWVILRAALLIRHLAKRQKEREVYRSVYCLNGPNKRQLH